MAGAKFSRDKVVSDKVKEIGKAEIIHALQDLGRSLDLTSGEMR